MKATIVDLRYKMNDVLKALARNETVTVLYHGKVKGIIIPSKDKLLEKIKEHPFFGMIKDVHKKSVQEELRNLRKLRYNDI